MRCLCRHGDKVHIGLWCLRCDDGFACCPPPQPIDLDEPGEPPPPVPRDGQRWRGGRKIPADYKPGPPRSRDRRR